MSLLDKPSNEDSDEELEYADTNSGVTDSARKPAYRKMSILVHTCLSNLFLWLFGPVSLTFYLANWIPVFQPFPARGVMPTTLPSYPKMMT